MKLFSIKNAITAGVILVLLIILSILVLAIIREVRSRNDNSEAIELLRGQIANDQEKLKTQIDSIITKFNEAQEVLTYLELNTFAQQQTGTKYEKQAAEIVAAGNDIRNARFQKLREQFWTRYQEGYYTNFPDH